MNRTELINSMLRRAGIEIRRKPPGLIRGDTELRATFEFVAAHYMSRRGDQRVTALQVGAFDGVANDSLSDALDRYGWTAVLVEPQASAYQVIRDRYADNPDVHTVCAAVDATDGVRALYSVRPGPGLPDWTQQIASFNRPHVAGALASLGLQAQEHLIVTSVPTMSFATLLDTTGMERIDVLLVDTEGFDAEILRLFDVPARLPSIISYEHEHLSRRERSVTADLLIACGYRLSMLSGGFDTIAYRR